MSILSWPLTTLSQKIREKKEEYSELNPELIEERKKNKHPFFL